MYAEPDSWSGLLGNLESVSAFCAEKVGNIPGSRAAVFEPFLLQDRCTPIERVSDGVEGPVLVSLSEIFRGHRRS